MSRGVKIGVVVLLLVVVGVIYNATRGDDDTTSHYSGSAATSASGISGSVTYKVTGTASSASLTYQNDTGGTEQHTVNLPWTKTYRGFGRGDFLYVSAQNQGERGTLRCEVKVRGEVVYSGDASGAYAICNASGSHPG